jgi:hypothetical protein
MEGWLGLWCEVEGTREVAAVSVDVNFKLPQIYQH